MSLYRKYMPFIPALVDFIIFNLEYWQVKRQYKNDEEIRRLLLASAVVVFSIPEIKNAIEIIEKDPRNIDVKAVTLLSIDILEKLFNLDEPVESQFFQYIIHGINKSLLLLREDGTRKDNIKKISVVWYRIYKIIRAYNSLQANQEMTKEELYEKVYSAVASLLG